ncbi:ferrous iron transport protein B [Clostridia bacterium]|nr:ferrous iron transport protein B [Clostridia bacterium]
MKIALAGNPNSGKTTLFNTLTGSNQHVGNWPGVTVEKKDGTLRRNMGETVIIQDLPGIYSLSPYTLEEIITRKYLISDRPDAIINIVDASNIERNLYLTTQILEVGIPVVIALNMIDIVQKKGDIIDIEKMSEKLGVPVLEMSALKVVGETEVVRAALLAAKSGKCPTPITFSPETENVLREISELIKDYVSPQTLRFCSIKLFEHDGKTRLELPDDVKLRIEDLVYKFEDKAGDDSDSVIINERYNYISRITEECVILPHKGELTVSDKIDKVVTSRVLALPIFAAVMFLVYYLSISTIGGLMTDWVNETLFGEIVPNGIGAFLERIGTAEWLNALILDGIVAGVGAVLGFIPQMLMLFLFLTLLEDCGYMSRIAFILDRIFKKFGLSGKSFIPILIGTGCGVPGILASRTIESESDRRMTIITTTFIPCSAKLPIIALIAGTFFPRSAFVAPSAYFIGMAAIIVSGVMLKKTKPFKGASAPFVMELPAYHPPKPSAVLRTTLNRGAEFVQRAGTIILLASVIIWFLSNHSFSFRVSDVADSMLAVIGGGLAPLFAPVGWGKWEAVVAALTGIIAKENIVGTMGVLYNKTGIETAFTPLAAYSFLLFNLLCAPCLAACGTVAQEMKSRKWTAFALGYQCGFAYIVAFIAYQLGRFFSGTGFGVGTVAALVLVWAMLMMLFRKGEKKWRQS